MAAKIIDGEAIAAKIKDGLKKEVEGLKAKGVKVRLVAIIATDNKGARIYAKSQARECEAVGIEYALDEMAADSTEEQMAERIRELNADKSVTAMILQMPLPEGVNGRKLQTLIAKEKDAEGMNPANMGTVIYGNPVIGPCTPLGAFELIKSTGVDLYGKEVVVVGHSEIVGKPIGLLVLDKFATTTTCHIATSEKGMLEYHTKRADILIVACGVPGLIKKEMVKPGAIVIDVGINRVPVLDEKGQPVLNEKGRKKMKTVGDCDFEGIKEIASYITPVPGGVGPMTVAMLLKNTVEAAKMQLGR